MDENYDLYIKKYLIYNSLFTDNCIDNIVNVAENSLNNPIFILDTSYRIITRSELAEKDDSCIEVQNGEHYLILDTVNLMKKTKCIDNIYNTNNAFFHYADQNLIFCSIKINDITTSYIAVLQSNRKFDDDDLELTNALSKVLAMQIQKENLFISNSGLDEEYYLIDLLINKISNIEYIKERLQNTNFKLNNNILMLSIPFKQQYADYRHNFGLKQLIRNLKNLLGNCIFTYYKDMIIFLISNDNEQVIDNNLKVNLLEFLNLNNLRCGISIVFNNLLSTQEFFQQSSYALSISEHLKIDEKIAYFENYIEYYLFHICSNVSTDLYKLDLSTLVHPWIKKIIYFDNCNKTELLKTLKEYFKNNRNANETSSKLNIHRSTFFYRFHKIQNLLRISLEDSSNLFKLELSFKILNYTDK